MAKSRGKKFEEQFKSCLENIKNPISVDRLKDTFDGFKGNSNICDFILYNYPNQIYLELKTTQGKYFNFGSDLRKNQYEGLLKKYQINGVIAGVIIWFIDYDLTIFLPIEEIEKSLSIGRKSINMNNLKYFNYLEIKGKKKRVFFEYDIEKFLEDIKTWKQKKNQI